MSAKESEPEQKGISESVANPEYLVKNIEVGEAPGTRGKYIGKKASIAKKRSLSNVAGKNPLLE